MIVTLLAICLVVIPPLNLCHSLSSCPDVACCDVPLPHGYGRILPSPVQTGWASQYDPGVMKRVVANQQRRGRLPSDLSGFDGFIAVQECKDVGKVYLIRPVGDFRWERFIAADCAGPHLRDDGLTGYEWMIAKGVLVEVGHPVALRWETVGRGIRIEMAEVP